MGTCSLSVDALAWLRLTNLFAFAVFLAAVLRGLPGSWAQADDSRACALRAGAAAVDITPARFPVIVNGYFQERLADQAHDRLMSRALVLDDVSHATGNRRGR